MAKKPEPVPVEEKPRAPIKGEHPIEYDAYLTRWAGINPKRFDLAQEAREEYKRAWRTRKTT